MKNFIHILKKDLCQGRRLMCLGVFFAFIFWVFESFLHFYVFKTCCFSHAFLWPEPHEVWMRLMVVGMFIIYGVYTQRLLDLRRKIEAEKDLLFDELEQIFQTAGDGMRVIDKDFNVIRRSDTYLELCGRRRKNEWLGKCFEEFPGVLCGTEGCPLKRIMRGETRLKFEVTKKRADGSQVPCYETATPFFARDGRLIGVVESYKDITPLKKYEDEIKKSQERALAFFKGNPVPCYIWKKLDNDFILDNYNDAAHEITHGRIVDLAGMRFSRFYKDSPDFIHDIWSCFEEKKVVKREVHYCFKSLKEEKDFIIIYSYIVPDSVLVHTEDITMRKEFERKVLDLSRFPAEDPNPVLRLDQESRLLYINPASLRLLQGEGWERGDFLKILPEHVDVLVKVVLRLRIPLMDLEVLVGEIVISYSLAPFPESGYVNFYGIDVTRRKKAEEHLRADKNVLEKTVDKKEALLIQASKQLQDARRFSDLGVLAATIAHELRNPLGVIRSAVYNINRKNSNQALRSHLLNIEKKISESDQIIRNLLTYSKISSPHYARVSLAKILDECVIHCGEKYVKWDVSIRRDAMADIGMIDADPIHITELFYNILDNAYQAFVQKKGIIKIAAGYAEGRDKVWISFEDNGIGMEDIDLQKVFEPFFTKKHRGIGLGLTVCAQVVRLHAGTIELKSRINEGTRVIVVLPVYAQVYAQ